MYVVICTHNRAGLLPRCLEAMQRQEGVTPADVGVVVIDNCSSDNTRHVVESFSNRTIPVHYIFEPTLGLSVARNTGLAASQSPLVAYIDDDAFAEPQWAAAVLSAFADGPPELAAIAGRVFPEWETERPACMTPFLEALYTVHDRGDALKVMAANEYFVGANMIFRRDILRELGGFATQLGRVGTSLLSNEETHLRDALAANGYACMYVPQAVVHHHISRDRLTPAYIRRRLLAQGQSDVVGRALKRGRASLPVRFIDCVLDAARVVKHSVRSCLKGNDPTAEYSRQLSVVALGRLQTSLGELVSR
jgi:glycosyltransferase involved in cell wall biosynthesis